MANEAQALLTSLRARVAAGETLSLEDLRAAYAALRADRISAYFASETKAKKEPKESKMEVSVTQAAAKLKVGLK